MSIAKAEFVLIGHGPLVYGKPVHGERQDDETEDQKDIRTWRQRAHVDSEGFLCVPSAAVKQSLCAAAKWLGDKFANDKKKTYTKRFQSGILCMASTFRVSRGGKDLTIDDVEEYPLFVPSNGQRGYSKRVWRRYPRVMPRWRVDGMLLVTDPMIDEEVFRRNLSCAGLHDGLGSMRIGTGGPNGMFEIGELSLTPYSI